MTAEELFYGFPEPVPAVCWRLRDLIVEVAPDAVEGVRPRWRLLGFELDGYFCAVAPQVDHARILFEHGVELDDPHAKLEGAGSQVRWLRYERVEDVDDDLVREFVRKAVAHQIR